MTLPNDKWEEIAPCIYQRRADYTPEQIAVLSRRPTEMINAALSTPSTLTVGKCDGIEKTEDSA